MAKEPEKKEEPKGEEKKPEPKSRRDTMYDSESSKKRREARKPREREIDEPESKEGDKGGDGEKKGGEHAEMLRRHENERRDLHGRHRAEHRTIDAEGGENLHAKKVNLHRKHEHEHAMMHARHEAEIMGATNSGNAVAEPAEPMAQAA